MIVQSSWKTSDDRPITNAVFATTESWSAALEDELMVENCILLEAPEKGDGSYPTVPACQLLFSCEPPEQISHISVLSEARVLEVYGHHGEYLKTVKNVLLEEAEDMVLFKGDIKLDVPVSLCSIKFVMLRSLSEMWFYGVRVHTVKAAIEHSNSPTFPMAAVEQRLEQMGLPLSEKAEAFKQLMQNVQKSNIMNQFKKLEPFKGDLMTNLLLSNLIQNKSPSPDRDMAGLQKCFSGQLEHRDSQNNIKELSNLITTTNPTALPETVSASNSPIIFQSISTSTQTEEDYIDLETKLKTLVVEQINEIDKKVSERFNQKFQEMEAKLMCKLEEIESFVKPQGMPSN